MIGAIAGDVIGSVHEGSRPTRKDFPLFVPGSRFYEDAEAFYGSVPADIQQEVWRRLDPALREEVSAFTARYGIPLSAGKPGPGR